MALKSSLRPPKLRRSEGGLVLKLSKLQTDFQPATSCHGLEKGGDAESPNVSKNKMSNQHARGIADDGQNAIRRTAESCFVPCPEIHFIPLFLVDFPLISLMTLPAADITVTKLTARMRSRTITAIRPKPLPLVMVSILYPNVIRKKRPTIGYNQSTLLLFFSISFSPFALRSPPLADEEGLY